MSITMLFDARFFRYIMKKGVFCYSIHLIAEQPAAVWPRVAFIAFQKNRGVITVRRFVNGEVHVEVTIVIIVEKSSHGRLYVNIQSVFGSHVFKMRNTCFIRSLV